MNGIRYSIYKTVHIYDGNGFSKLYKYVMIFFIVLSILPLTQKESTELFFYTDAVCLAVFSADYLLRFVTADLKFGEKGWRPFVRYPLRLISIIDILSVFALACSVAGWSEALRLTEVLAVLRIVRLFRYSKSIRTILDILKKSKKPLIAVGSLAIGYILLSAVIIFNVEPDSFESFFDAVYWATVSLTTVGYGDIYPVTVLGRMVTMISSFFGIAIVALPAGVVTAEYLNAIKDNQDNDKK